VKYYIQKFSETDWSLKVKRAGLIARGQECCGYFSGRACTGDSPGDFPNLDFRGTSDMTVEVTKTIEEIAITKSAHIGKR
jgi:hypothetical protein